MNARKDRPIGHLRLPGIARTASTLGGRGAAVSLTDRAVIFHIEGGTSWKTRALTKIRSHATNIDRSDETHRGVRAIAPDARDKQARWRVHFPIQKRLKIRSRMSSL